MSSTIDAAIINTISDIKAQSGGAFLTSGDGINITSGTINVKYNTATMELVNGALSAKTTSSGGGGNYMPNYIINQGLGTSMGHLNVNIDNITIGINDNNALYVKSSSGSGNVPTEDVLTRYPTQRGIFTNSFYTVLVHSSGRMRARSGNVIRLRNARTEEIESYILVMKTDTVPETRGDSNAIIIGQDGISYPIYVSIGGSGDCEIDIPAESGVYEEFSAGTDVGTDMGLFRNDQMSYNTLCLILRYSTGED